MRRIVTIALTLAVASACTSEPKPRTSNAVEASGCAPVTSASRNTPVDLELWSFVATEERKVFEHLVEQFNGSHRGIRLTLTDRSGVPGSPSFQLVNAPPDERPDLTMLDAGSLRPAVDARTLLPIDACLDERDSSLSELLPAAVAAAAVDGTQWGVPYGASAPMLFYDAAALRRAGRSEPPARLDEVTGMVVADTVPLFLAAGATLDHLDAGDGAAVANWLADAGRRGDVRSTGDERSALLELGNGAAMVVASSTNVATVAPALRAGQAPGVELGIAPLPTPSGTSTVTFRSDALYLVADRAPDETAAGVTFLSWLVEAQQQSELASRSELLPVNPNAFDLEPLESRWRSMPELDAAWRVLTSNPTQAEPSTAPWGYLRGEVADAGRDLVDQRRTADDVVTDLAARAASNIAGYEADRARFARCSGGPQACFIDLVLVVMGADGSDETTVTAPELRASAPSWSPDGQTIVFQTNGDAAPDIYTVGADGANVRRLTDDPAPDVQPDWSPDGRRIVFQSNRTGDGDIYSMAADGSDVRRLTSEVGTVDRNPQYSPDGTHIVFVRERLDNGALDLVVVDEVTGDERVLVESPVPEFFPAWSPDGERVAFVTSHDGVPSLDVIDIDGTRQRVVVANRNVASPEWSPSGSQLLFVDNSPSHVTIVDVDGSNLRHLSRSLAYYDTPSFSPDGQRIVAGWHGWTGERP